MFAEMESRDAKIQIDFSFGEKGERGERGERGESAYEVAVEAGYEGTESEFAERLQGAKKVPIEITQEELVRLRDDFSLMLGQSYRIVDYVSHYDEYEVESAKHQYDLIVTVNGLNSFHEDAKAVLHEGDDYFANSDLSKWQVKINNNLKVIWMRDEYGNEANYDFKNVLFPVLLGDEMLSLYTFSLEGEDYSLNPTPESVVGSEIDIAYTIGGCQNNVITSRSIPDGFQGKVVFYQSAFAVNLEIVTGIENNRLTIEDDVSFVVVNHGGSASENSISLMRGSNVFIPMVNGFNYNVIRGLSIIECAEIHSYALVGGENIIATFNSNVIVDSRIRNRGSFNFFQNAICNTEMYNANIVINNSKIVGCEWKIYAMVESFADILSIDILQAVNTNFILNYAEHPEMSKSGKVFSVGSEGDIDYKVFATDEEFYSYILQQQVNG